MKNQKGKKENSITLIALIITIIVMLIFVSVTVRTVVQSVLFGHASKATGGYSMHQAREQLATTWLATRGVYHSGGSGSFTLRFISGNSFSGLYLFGSTISNKSGVHEVRPVVRIPATYKLQSVPGTTEFEIVKK